MPGKVEEIKVSVILPCYNGARWLKASIESVLAQTYHNIELLVIDDGSTDESKKIINFYSFDERLRYIYQKNRGFSAAINTGVRESIGSLLGFIGQDDLWQPDKVEIQVKFFQKFSEIGLVYSNYSCIDSNDFVFRQIKAKFPDFASKEKLIQFLFLNNFMGFETILVKRECFLEVGLFDEAMVAFSDHDMWLRIVEYFNVGYINKSLVKKRVHGSQLSQAGLIFGLRDEFHFVEKAIKRQPLLKKLKKKKLMSLHYSLGILLLNNGDKRGAKQELIESFKCNPLYLKPIGVCLLPKLYTFMTLNLKKQEESANQF
jgi:glycosyltransferase involved in cell wall biosynthesis